MVSLGSPGLKAVEQKRVCLWIRLRIQWQKASGAPIFLSLSSIRACGTLSKALTRSTRRVWTSWPSCGFLWSAWAFSNRRTRIAIGVSTEPPFTNPKWLGSMSWNSNRSSARRLATVNVTSLWVISCKATGLYFAELFFCSGRREFRQRLPG